MQRSTNLRVVKSPTGLHWWVIADIDPKHPLAVRDTKWEAELERDDLNRVVDYAAGIHKQMCAMA